MSLNELKDMYQTEKSNLEKRLINEQIKNDENLSKLQEEFYTRFNEEIQNKDEEIDQLTQHLEDIQNELSKLL